MKNYEEMSDFEINKSVACHLGEFWYVRPCNSETGGWLYSENYDECDTSTGQASIELPNYCNNPSDAWPIIMQNKISVLPWNSNEWQAFMSLGCAEGIRFRVINKNPLRAAMIVFLMMQEQAK